MKNTEESPYKGKTGLRRIFKAATYSVDGLSAAWHYEVAFRQICLLAVVGIGAMFWLPLPALARVLITFSHLFCVVVELINSAIEAAVDHTSLAEHPLAKRAKDVGSAAQLVALLNLFIVWGA